jgi:transcription elongation factor GreB
MSKAFTKEGDGDAPPLLPARAPLPAGTPNYVTPRGLRALRAELAALEAERARLGEAASGEPAGEVAGEAARRAALLRIGARRVALEERLASAVLVAPGARGAEEEVRFGARVELRTAGGDLRRYQIVGVDEADAAAGRLAFVAPLARALLGRRVGEAVEVRTARGAEEVEIVAVAYDPEEPQTEEGG